MKKNFLLSSGLNFLLFFMFMNLLIRSVDQSGWTIFSILLALIATHDFVQGFRLLMFYLRIKDN